MRETTSPIIRRAWSCLLLAIALWLCGCTGKKEPAAPSPLADEAAAKAPCTWCPEPSAKDCAICVAQNPLLPVGTDGSISVVLPVCNQTDKALTPTLHISDFFAPNSAGQPTPLGATVSLSAVVPADAGIVQGTAELAANRCIAVKLQAAKVFQAGPLSATLFNGEASVVELKAVRYPLPFDLKVVGPTPDKVDLLFVRANPAKATIRLRNDDQATYRFRWRLQLDGQDVAAGVATAFPTQPVDLQVSLAEDPHFSFLDSGFLRPGRHEGRLLLQHQPDESFRLRPVEQKTISVTARFSSWPPIRQTIYNSLQILCVLILGIVVSLLINYALPMQRKRLAIKQRMSEHDGRLAGLSGMISSRRLNLLRTEKKRLREELRRNRPYFPTTEDVLPRLEANVEALGRRIDLTVGAGQHLAALKDEEATAPREAEKVIEHCRAVLEIAEKPAPDEAELKAARAALDAAAAVRLSSDDKPSAADVADLRDRVVTLGQVELPKDADWKPFDELLAGLRQQFLPDALTDPNREQYVRAARAVWKAQIIAAFTGLVTTTGNDEVRKARMGRAPRLLQSLLPGPEESLRVASVILREIEQNVDKRDVVAALRIANSVRIEADPPTPTAYQLVTFRAILQQPGLNTADARHQIKCYWKVSGPEWAGGCPPLTDNSWAIGYYFERAGRFRRLRHWLTEKFKSSSALTPPAHFNVEVTFFEDQGSSAVATARALVELEPTKSYALDSVLMSISTLGVTVLIVGLGLLAGAQEKIQTLDWWSALLAVLVLGFGADALKRVLMKP